MHDILETILNRSNILNREALVYNEKRYSYDEINQWVNKYVHYFEEQGVKKGDKIILDMTNTPEFLFTYFSIIYIGAIIVPINPLSTPMEIAGYIQDCHAKYFVTNSLIAGKLYVHLEGILAKLGVKGVIITQDVMNEVNAIRPKRVLMGLESDKPCTFIYTSGTTGKPKAAMLSLKNLLANAKQLENTVSVSSKDCWISCLPMFHAYGFTVATLLPLTTNATMILVEQFHPKMVVDLLVQERVTVFSGVPMMYIMMAGILKEPMKNDLRIGWVGGDSIEGEMFEHCTKMLDIDLCEGYGLSEAAPVCMLNLIPEKGTQLSSHKYQLQHKIGSIGPAIVGVEAKIVDEEGIEVGVNEAGELIVRGDNVMLGYYNQEDETTLALRDGWLYTGDIARVDENGYYYIEDRKKDIIIVGGLNIYSKQVENAICEHSLIQEAAVVGIKDKKRGEAVKAFIVLKEGESLPEIDLRHFLLERLANYKVPKHFEFVQALPKNALGKILKKVLREQY